MHHLAHCSQNLLLFDAIAPLDESAIQSISIALHCTCVDERVFCINCVGEIGVKVLGFLQATRKVVIS